jgi:hypothetical protein
VGEFGVVIGVSIQIIQNEAGRIDIWDPGVNYECENEMRWENTSGKNGTIGSNS